MPVTLYAVCRLCGNIDTRSLVNSSARWGACSACGKYNPKVSQTLSEAQALATRVLNPI